MALLKSLKWDIARLCRNGGRRDGCQARAEEARARGPWNTAVLSGRRAGNDWARRSREPRNPTTGTARFSTVPRWGAVVGAVALTLLITACASTFRFEPETGEERLLIGRIEAHISGYPETHGIDLTGTQRFGVDIELRNEDTNEIYETSSFDGAGHFYLEDPTPGEYNFVRIRYREESDDGAWYEVYSAPDFRFDVGQDGVTNLGTLVWEIDQDQGARLRQQRDFRDFQADFADRYDESMWNDRSWRSASLWRP